jgi:C-terminal processing protease CtpA/Prc
MSLQEKVRNIVFYFIKKEYRNYLDEHQLKYIEDDKIEEVVELFYIRKEKLLQKFIRENLKKMMKSDYPGALVENIIYDIFEDESLAKNRIIIEIQQFQKVKSNSILSNNAYQVNIIPNKKHGLGINLSISNDKIMVEGFKKNPDNNNKLPAEDIGLINIGDELLEIDNNKLKSMKIDKVIHVLKSMNKKHTEVNIKFDSVKNNKMFEHNYNQVCT